MTADDAESQPSPITLNDVALVAGVVVGIGWVAIFALGYTLFSLLTLEYQPYPPAALYCSYILATTYAPIGGLAGILSTTVDRCGFNGWISAIGMWLAVTAATNAVRLPFDFPNRGPHELVVSILFGSIAFTLASIVLMWRVKGAKARTWTFLALTIATVASVISTPVFRNPNLDTQLPLGVLVDRTRSSDIQDYSMFSLTARPVDLAEAEKYAERVQLTSGGSALSCPVANSITSEPVRTWQRDERVPMTDTSRYPLGYSGCQISACWRDGVLSVVENCDWGI